MCSNGGLSHFDDGGNARMVDISEKVETSRSATAVGIVEVKPDTFNLIEKGEIGKGDVLGVSRVAGIMAAKKTSEIIPMCHPLAITGSDIEFILDKEKSLIRIEATVKTFGKTGVEMEALTAATAAGLTIYDMCKAVDKDIKIKEVYLLKKTGGKSGAYERTAE